MKKIIKPPKKQESIIYTAGIGMMVASNRNCPWGIPHTELTRQRF